MTVGKLAALNIFHQIIGDIKKISIFFLKSRLVVTRNGIRYKRKAEFVEVSHTRIFS